MSIWNICLNRYPPLRGNVLNSEHCIIKGKVIKYGCYLNKLEITNLEYVMPYEQHYKCTENQRRELEK